MDEFAKHEFLDRANLIGSVFEDFVASHPASEFLPPEIKTIISGISNKFGELYQKLGEFRFDEPA